MELADFYAIEPYSLTAEEKNSILLQFLLERISYHFKNCREYQLILSALNFDFDAKHDLAYLPFIPVRLFKQYELLSVARENITKTLTSSGTSGQAVSKIFLDANNVRNQTKTLNEIISSFIGKKRLPLLLLDTEMIKKDRSMYSARGAGIIGFSIFGYDSKYALNEKMEIEIERIIQFFKEHHNEPILMFGYTYIVWQYIIRELEKRDIFLNAHDAILFHIGGWKKLKEQAVDACEFNRRAKERFGNVRVYNYYGMAEQLGSVFVECECGHMHCSNYSDIIIRRPIDFSPALIKEKGLIELLSILPTSYPGHILLTEDEGEILGIDDCPCGRKGKYFKIHGRIKSAELRGCSDTFEQH